MRTLTWYLDTARARLNATSDAQLSYAIDMERAAASQYRRGIAFPSEDAMIRLAVLCRVSPEEALCELHVWRAEKAHSSERASLYKKLLAKAVAGSVALLALAPALEGQRQNASASAFPQLYIMRFWRRLLGSRSAAHAH